MNEAKNEYHPASGSELFRVHDALGNWMIEDVRMGRMICMTTRERDAKYICDALRAFDPPNAPDEARCKASPPAGGSALCQGCAANDHRGTEWDPFHYGTRQPCDQCGTTEGLRTLMPNAAVEARRNAVASDGLLAEQSKGEQR